MFWPLRVRDEIRQSKKDIIDAGAPIIIRDEKTMSGRVHIGSLRGVVIHGIISEALSDAGIANTFFFEINDFDPMDGLPVYLDEKRYSPFMGQPLYTIPSPDDSAENFAEYWANDFKRVIDYAGFKPTYYRASELYLSGRMNGVIRAALDHADLIRSIYKEVSGSEKSSDWFPLQVICESCGKVGTTKVTGWNGSQVEYVCEENLVAWAKGCGNRGSIDPFDGRSKLPWKVEWPAKFSVVGVHVEGAGKDHNTKGGSRDLARRLLNEVFRYPEPHNIPYDFIVLKGKKMSSSKGRGASSSDMADILPPSLIRLLMLKEPKRPIDFEPSGETIPTLFDLYDGLMRGGKSDDDRAIVPFLVPPAERGEMRNRYLPRFSTIAYLAQMPHVDIYEKVAELKGTSLTDEDRSEVDLRVRYAKLWLEQYSPEKYRFELQTALPEGLVLSDLQKKALRKIEGYLSEHTDATGETMHAYLHELKKELSIEPRDLFSAIYQVLLGKDSGPQAGWFLSALDRSFVLKRIKEATE